MLRRHHALSQTAAFRLLQCPNDVGVQKLRFVFGNQGVGLQKAAVVSTLPSLER
jgi:hypothetical protein